MPLTLFLSKKGFTLMEALVSIVLLGIVILGFNSVFVYGNRITSYVNRRIQALNFVRQTLEELKNGVRQDTWDTGDLKTGVHPFLAGDFPADLQDWSAAGEYAVNQVGSFAIRSASVTVQWNEP